MSLCFDRRKIPKIVEPAFSHRNNGLVLQQFRQLVVDLPAVLAGMMRVYPCRRIQDSGMLLCEVKGVLAALFTATRYHESAYSGFNSAFDDIVPIIIKIVVS